MEITIISIIHMIMTAYNIILSTISMKSIKNYHELKKKNEWQAKKIKDLTERLRNETETKTH